MANNENLIDNSKRSPNEVRENGKKGGIKSGEVRRAKKTMKEMLNYLLEKEITNKKGESKNTLEAISISMIQQALKGNVKAFECIRDTIGEKNIDTIININQAQTIQVNKKDIDDAVKTINELK